MVRSRRPHQLCQRRPHRHMRRGLSRSNLGCERLAHACGLDDLRELHARKPRQDFSAAQVRVVGGTRVGQLPFGERPLPSCDGGARRPLISGAWPGSASIHESQRTWRLFVTASPQAGQLQSGSARAGRSLGRTAAITALRPWSTAFLRSMTAAAAIRRRAPLTGEPSGGPSLLRWCVARLLPAPFGSPRHVVPAFSPTRPCCRTAPAGA